MPEPERTFKRFGASEDGTRWDLTEVVDEHSEHIEWIEMALESLILTVTRLVKAVGKQEDADAKCLLPRRPLAHPAPCG